MAAALDEARSTLDEVNAAREVGLSACRRTIRAAGSAIRAVHRRQGDDAARLLGECEASVRQAQAALAPHPALAGAGFLHDAEKEYAEAVLTAALISGPTAGGPVGEPGRSTLASAAELGVGPAAWCCGLAEAASELRRSILDLLRQGDLAEAEGLFASMQDTYELLCTVDLPDAVTGGLRRTNDALRAVLERTRSDLTTTTLQSRLQAAIEGRPSAGAGSGADHPLR